MGYHYFGASSVQPTLIELRRIRNENAVTNFLKQPGGNRICVFRDLYFSQRNTMASWRSFRSRHLTKPREVVEAFRLVQFGFEIDVAFLCEPLIEFLLIWAV